MSDTWGTMWADSNPKRPLADKVRDGAASYKRRFKQEADLCYLAPATAGGVGESAVDGIRLVLVNNMPVNHLFLTSTQPVPPPTLIIAAEPEPQEEAPPPVIEESPAAPTPAPPRNGNGAAPHWVCSARCGDLTAWAMNLTWCPTCGAKLERIEL